MDGLPDSVDMSLSKLRKTVKDRKAWCAAVRGGHKESDTTEQPNNKNNDRSAETKLVAARKGVRM